MHNCEEIKITMNPPANLLEEAKKYDWGRKKYYSAPKKGIRPGWNFEKCPTWRPPRARPAARCAAQTASMAPLDRPHAQTTLAGAVDDAPDATEARLKTRSKSALKNLL